ncbi:VPLPA-CTERM sorting domain-containing protein [Arenibacterium sp. CAU 1754]
MKHARIALSVAAILSANTAIAAPISALSGLDMSHSFVINGGNSPEGIDIVNRSGTLEISTGATSAVDDPAAVLTEESDAVVGNPFSDPPLAAELSRSSTTLLPNGFEGAQSGFDNTNLFEADPDQDNFDITRKSVTQQGFASASITSDPIAASASSFLSISRDFRFDNTTDDLISFNIFGQFEADLLAQYTGIDGFARTSGGFNLLFDLGDGASLTHFPISVYQRSIEDSAPGATITEQLLINSGGISGVSFTASATAIGDGGTTTATFEGQNSYIFGVSLDPGASITMKTSFFQANAVEYTPQPEIASVPLPASLPLLIAGLMGLFVLRRKQTPA